MCALTLQRFAIISLKSTWPLFLVPPPKQDNQHDARIGMKESGNDEDGQTSSEQMKKCHCWELSGAAKQKANNRNKDRQKEK
jgi:hypothetical protein